VGEERRRMTSDGGRDAAQLTKPGQHDRTPVTTKHEKRLYANPLFAVNYGSFQGRPFHKLAPSVRPSGWGFDVIGIFPTTIRFESVQPLSAH
jgi:hypothetical protein